MIIVLKAQVTNDEIDHIVNKIEKLGLKAHISRGEQQTIIGVIGDESKLIEQPIEAISGVEKVLPVVKQYKLASRDFHADNTVISHAGISIGGGNLCIIAGPCTVESEEQTMTISRAIKKGGAHALRGGAYKPRTSPYAFQGLGKKGLEILLKAKKEVSLPIITEVMDPRNVELVAEYADFIQIGARNIQNFDLLKEVGKQPKPIVLKRGMMSTINEFLMSAEYILAQGNEKVILCERGIRTFETSTRSSLDLCSIPVLQRETHLPVIVDPSHAAGYWRYVEPLSLAAIAAGADGLMIEVHNSPENAMVDGAQSLLPKNFSSLVEKVRSIHSIIHPS